MSSSQFSNQNIAIVDLGTNTFHLLITKILPGHSFSIIERLQIPVKIGEGMKNNKISEEAITRGLEAIQEIKELMDGYEIAKIKAVGTSALRSSINAKDFLKKANKILGSEIEVISGDREATLIYYGVRWAVGMWEEPAMIIDIGGGSVEFIIANKYKIFWKQSFDVGASRLIQKFPHPFPINEALKTEIENYLRRQLKPLFEICKKYKLHALIGASGSFETYTLLEIHYFLFLDIDRLPLMHPIQMDNYAEIRDMILGATKEQLYGMKGMAAFRIEMMVVSTILKDLILRETGINKLYYSDYALKEGVLWETLKETND